MQCTREHLTQQYAGIPARRGWFTRGWFALAVSAVIPSAACHVIDDETTDATDPAAEIAFPNRSNAAEYCAVLSTKADDLPVGLDPVDTASALLAVGAIADLEAIAPEADQADWAAMRALFQKVVESHEEHDDISTASWAAAEERFTETKGRLIDTMRQICPDDLSWAGSPGYQPAKLSGGVVP